MTYRDPENGAAALNLEDAERAGDQSRRTAWIRQLWSERRILKRVTLWGLLLGVVTAILIPARYESTARLMPPDQSGSGLAMLAALAGRGGGGGMGGVGGALGGGLGNIAGDLLGLKTSGALFIDILGGPTVQDDLIRQFDLRKVYWRRYWMDARKELTSRTDLKEDRKSGVITIQVSDRDPKRAQQLTAAYVDELNRIVALVSTSAARRERIFIEQRLKTVKQDLDTSARQFSDFASKNGTLDVPSQSKAMLEAEANLQGQLVAAESELEGLKQIYTDNNIRVRTLDARVAGLRKQAENMSGNKSDLTSDVSQIAGNFPSIRKLPLLGVQWANLYRDAKIQETVYELLTQEYELAKVQEAKEIPSVNVLDPPLLPERKSFPPRILITLLGGILALFMGSSFIIGSEIWRQNESAEKQLATEIWSHIAAPDSKTRLVVYMVWSKLSGRNGSSASNSKDRTAA